MMRALWLTSWYPNKLDPWNGDFIQRHARAAAMFGKIDVIHLQRGEDTILKEEIEIEKRSEGNLSEEIVLYKSKYPTVFKRIFSVFEYKKIFRQQIKNYIKENGLPDIVHVHVPMKAGLLGLWMKKKFGIEYVLTEHWTLYSNSGLDKYKDKNLLFKFYSKKIFKNAKLFLPVSDNLGNLVCKNVADISFKTIYNVVDTKHFYYKECPAENVFTFVHVSTLGEQKNPRAIIDAFGSFNKKFPSSKLILVGEKHKHLLDYVESEKIDSIEFTGMISYESVAKILQQSDVFILFSKYENMPCAVLETLCCGLPVIASDVGGLREIITHENGILISADNLQELISAMKTMYTAHKNYNRKRISKDAVSKFSYEIIGKQINNVYENIKRKK